jgi:acetyl-CoA carboxylase carboxyl transferase subunit beta
VDLLDLVLDADSYESWDEPIDTSIHPPAYREALAAAAERAGTDEAVLTGRGLVNGRPVAVVVNEFAFLGGSIGCAAAARIVAAVRRATADRLPLLAATASGGTRMQEGTVAFVQMVAITCALMDHRAAGLPYLVYLRHPTVGGTYASWGSLGHITVAEPGALIGFLGPKVYEAINDRPFPPGVQTAENLAGHGMIDAVVPPSELRPMLDRTLSVLIDPPVPQRLTVRTSALPSPGSASSAGEAIRRTREQGRPDVRALLRWGATDIVRLPGDRVSAVLVALARWDGQPCVVVGQDRQHQAAGHPLGPAALRQARRGMRLADELGLPLVTVIDTPGAELSRGAEEGGLAAEIARCIATLATLRGPTVSVLLGEGCGGGALALLPARRIIATEHAWLSPLPPEGASAIVHGDVHHAAQIAEEQHVRATDLVALGVIHGVVPELPGDTERQLALAVAAAVSQALGQLTASPA